MRKRTYACTYAVAAALLLLAVAGFAKDKKKKPTLPPYVLTAHTVAVLVDPEAGVSIENPRANQIAQKDVETALLNWGRFEPTIDTQAADLIVVVRKGSGRLVDQTVSDPRQNSRPGVITPTNNGIGIGAQEGHQRDITGTPEGQAAGIPPHPQAEIGNSEDTFTVYEGRVEHALDSVPAWRYISRDALHSHDVPAVTAFRKACEEAEKAAAKNP